MEFKAKNNGRKRKHRHLFTLKETVKAIEADSVPLKLAVSKVPIENWITLLETSGWGVIEDTHFFYA